jgi:hypothetical protein
MNSVVKKTRKKNTPQTLIYYDEWSGGIQQIGNGHLGNMDDPFIVSSASVLRKIIDGSISENKYIVSTNSNGVMSLFEKDDIIRLRRQEDDLAVLPRGKFNQWDIRLTLFAGNMKMIVKSNQSSLQKLTAYSESIDRILSYPATMMFYFTERNNHNRLLATVEIDQTELFNSPYLVIDLDGLISRSDIFAVDILTCRQFEYYDMEIFADRFIEKSIHKGSGRIFKIATVPECDMTIAISNNRAIVKSNVTASRFSEIGLSGKTFTLYAIRGSLDALVSPIEINLTRLKENGEVHIDLIEDCMHCNIIHNNPHIIISRTDSNDTYI